MCKVSTANIKFISNIIIIISLSLGIGPPENFPGVSCPLCSLQEIIPYTAWAQNLAQEPAWTGNTKQHHCLHYP